MLINPIIIKLIVRLIDSREACSLSTPSSCTGRGEETKERTSPQRKGVKTKMEGRLNDGVHSRPVSVLRFQRSDAETNECSRIFTSRVDTMLSGNRSLGIDPSIHIFRLLACPFVIGRSIPGCSPRCETCTLLAFSFSPPRLPRGTLELDGDLCFYSREAERMSLGAVNVGFCCDQR